MVPTIFPFKFLTYSFCEIQYNELILFMIQWVKSLAPLIQMCTIITRLIIDTVLYLLKKKGEQKFHFKICKCYYGQHT